MGVLEAETFKLRDTREIHKSGARMARSEL